MEYPLLVLTDDSDNLVIKLTAAKSSSDLTPTLTFYTDATGSNSETTEFATALSFEKWYFLEAQITGSSIIINIDGVGTKKDLQVTSTIGDSLTNYTLGKGTNTLI